MLGYLMTCATLKMSHHVFKMTNTKNNSKLLIKPSSCVCNNLLQDECVFKVSSLSHACRQMWHCLSAIDQVMVISQ